MKKELVTVSCLIVLSALVYWATAITPTTSGLVSPDSQLGKISSNIWFPKISTTFAQEADLKLTAKAAYIVDADSGEVLYEKNAKERYPIASLTKIMTVIVALEHKDWDDWYSVSAHAAGMEPDHMMLIEGEKLRLRELLDGIFMVSANDAAEAIAEGTTGNRQQFIDLMNKKSLFLGMKDTLFINPSGLQEDDQQQFSTAYDVALMSRYAIKKFPQLLDISSQTEIYLPVTETHQDYTLPTGINLVSTYPGVVGFKTGYTPEAGLTLVTVAKRQGHTVVGVLLGSESRRDDARALLDQAFHKLGVDTTGS